MSSKPTPPPTLADVRNAIMGYLTDLYGPDVSAELLIYTSISTTPGRIPFGILPLYWKQKRARQRRERKRLLKKLRHILELRRLRKKKGAE